MEMLKQTFELINEAGDVCAQAAEEKIPASDAAAKFDAITASMAQLRQEQTLFEEQCRAEGREPVTPEQMQSFFTSAEGQEIAKKVSASLKAISAACGSPHESLRSSAQKFMTLMGQ